MDQIHEELYLRLRLGSNSQSSAKGIKQGQDKTGANTKISRQIGAGSYRWFYPVSLHLHPVRLLCYGSTLVTLSYSAVLPNYDCLSRGRQWIPHSCLLRRRKSGIMTSRIYSYYWQSFWEHSSSQPSPLTRSCEGFQSHRASLQLPRKKFRTSPIPNPASPSFSMRDR